MNISHAALEVLLQKGNITGSLFPQYRFVREEDGLHQLGSGGFAIVYEMTDLPDQNRRLAMKVTEADRGTHASFMEEVRGWQRLSRQSPYVMSIVDAAEWEGMWCILMERGDKILGRSDAGDMCVSREELLHRTGILQFAVQIGQALRVSHENGILHGDIKPENIYWNVERNCYQLSDFESWESRGFTRGYAAPEIIAQGSCEGAASKERGYTVTSDIYSYGMSLYVLLNRLHFPGTEGYYSSTRQYDPEYVFPAPLDSTEMLTRSIRKMCEWNPEKRYQTMEEILADLDRIMREDCL